MVLFCVTGVVTIQSGDKYTLTKDEFLSQMDKNNITFKHMDVLNQTAKATVMTVFKIRDEKRVPNKMVLKYEDIFRKNMQREHSEYNDDLMMIRYVDYAGKRYMISYDFATTKKCTLRISKLDSKCGNVVCGGDPKRMNEHPNVDYMGTEVPMKYCKKIYKMGRRYENN